MLPNLVFTNAPELWLYPPSPPPGCQSPPTHLPARPAQAVDFATNCGQITNMGFSLALAAGALVKHSNNPESATEACLLSATSG